jgi:hypothetical protein
MLALFFQLWSSRVRAASPAQILELGLRGRSSPLAVVFLLFPDSFPGLFQTPLKLRRKGRHGPGVQGLRQFQREYLSQDFFSGFQTPPRQLPVTVCVVNDAPKL